MARSGYGTLNILPVLLEPFYQASSPILGFVICPTTPSPSRLQHSAQQLYPTRTLVSNSGRDVVISWFRLYIGSAFEQFRGSCSALVFRPTPVVSSLNFCSDRTKTLSAIISCFSFRTTVQIRSQRHLLCSPPHLDLSGGRPRL